MPGSQGLLEWGCAGHCLAYLILLAVPTLCVCMCACEGARVCMCVHACVSVCACVLVYCVWACVCDLVVYLFIFCHTLRQHLSLAKNGLYLTVLAQPLTAGFTGIQYHAWGTVGITS